MLFFTLILAPPLLLPGSTLTVELQNGEGVTAVGALRRWDEDGNHRKLPDPKAKIDGPYLDAKAKKIGENRWEFKDLPAGTYDLVLLAKNRVRIEGFQYVPVREFDPFFPQDAKTGADTRKFLLEDIRKSPHYENKVVPLYLGGTDKAVRVLVMLLRDKPTSYEHDFPGAATLRHEIWQYSSNYGAWRKEKRTKVLDRVLLHRDELRRWTWLWDPKLGGIKIKSHPVTIKYEIPKSFKESKLKGLFPY